jgi:excisionase family DNA binding protein
MVWIAGGANKTPGSFPQGAEGFLSLLEKAVQMPAKPIPKKYVPKKNACETFHVSMRTIDRWVAEGRIKAYRIGPKLIRLDLDEVERALVGDR